MVIQLRCCGNTVEVHIAKALWLTIVQHQVAGSQGSMEKVVNYLVWMFSIFTVEVLQHGEWSLLGELNDPELIRLANQLPAT